MSEANSSIFEEPRHVAVLRRLRLIKPEHRAQAFRRVLIAIAIAWVPMAVLCAVQWLASGDTASLRFFTDVAAYARFLLGIPILILAEYIILPRLDATAQQFVYAGLIDPADRGLFDETIATTRRLSTRIWPSAGMIILVYVCAILFALFFPRELLPPWQQAADTGRLSLAGWWHMLVSMPLVLGLILSWIWRVGVWIRFLYHVSRMRLHLVPSHPDQAAGLQFVSFSPRLFTPLAFTLGIIAAGTLANEVVQMGLKPLEHGAIPIATAIVVTLIFISPPLVFARPLMLAWRRGVFEYGGLASKLGKQFEQKWLAQQSTVDDSSLEQPDFSATVDLYGVAGNVYSMRPVLFDLRSAMSLAIATLLPFAPIWLSVIPAKVVVSQLLHMLV